MELIKISTKRDLAIERLRAAIIDCDLQFGELLSENVLAARLGISKTPIHDALLRLQSEGLVEVLPQRGARVFDPSDEMVEDLCRVRLLLEQEAMRLAFERRGAELVVALARTVARMTTAKNASDVRSYLHLDTEFHRHFYTLCGSPTLCATYSLIDAKVAAIRTHLAASQPTPRSAGYREHQRIVACLQQGRATKAAEILTSHVLRTCTFFPRLARRDAPARLARAE
jgi:DNA-binding GntR family transcriptional regulator